jgi:gliding motility-associated-like protein
MKRILPLITCILGFLSFNASAQWVPITHQNGLQNYGAVGVTVTNNNGITGGGCGGFYWIQQTGASYTFNFSPAVDAIWIVVDAINTGESIEISINGPQFPITNCNLVQTPYVNPCSVGNCNIVNGQFVNNTPFWVCGGVMVFYGPITSFTISEPIGGSGTTFNISMVPPGNTIPPTGTGAGSITASSNGPVCEGTTLNLSSTGTNGTYSWTGPNGFNSTLQNPSIPGVTLAAAGDYIVESNTPCGIVKDTVTVSVLANPVAPTLNSNSPVCQGYPINLTATNMPVGTITWSGPNGFGSTLQNPVIPGAQAWNAGVYSAFVTNGVCVSPSSTTTVVVNPTPLAPTVTHVEICQFSPMPPITAVGSSLLWYTTATGGTGSASAPSPSNATPGVTSYWVSQTVNGCESPRTQLNVTVKPKPIPPFYTGPHHYCRDEPATPMPIAGTNVQWYDNNQNPIAGAPTVNTSVPGDYTWYADQTHDGCTSDKTMITIHVADIPAPPVVADITQCQFDEPQQLTAIGTAVQWYDVPVGGSPYVFPSMTNTDNPGTITWYATQTVDGCESPRAPQLVTINHTPTSTFDVSRPLVCENDTLGFFYTGDGLAPYTYTWTLPANDSVVLVSGTTDNPNPLVIRFDETGDYPVSLTVDNQGCKTTTTYNVKVVLVPAITISVPSDVCVHDTVKVGMASYNQPLTAYDWNFAGGVNVFNDISGGFYRIRWDNAGMYPVSVQVTNTACTGTHRDTVVVHDAPSAEFSIVSAGKICIGDSVRLAAVDNNGLYSYEWSPERYFNQDNNFAPVVNAYIAGEQAISLTVKTPWGCEATHENPINPDKCCIVTMPNVFTPNGDGKNDIFRPITVGTHSIKKFLIVNRWGQKVFETANEYEGWDGTFKGADQNMDTYFWVLQYKCDGKDQEQKGEVIILR